MSTRSVRHDASTSVPNAGLLLGQPPGEVELRHLRTSSEIQQIMRLRDEIDLSAHFGREDFETVEKKETSAASSADSI